MASDTSHGNKSEQVNLGGGEQLSSSDSDDVLSLPEVFKVLCRGGVNQTSLCEFLSSDAYVSTKSPSELSPKKKSSVVVADCPVTVAPNGEGSSWLDGSDSCPSVSPSPGPEVDESFSFGDMASLGGATEELSAALQAEKEFLDFMCSLPQVQETTPREGEEYENPTPREEVSSLDHLGHLCRVVEQLAQLKEQNSRLQRRVHYLEDLRLLHKMHRQVTETLAHENLEDGQQEETAEHSADSSAHCREKRVGESSRFAC